MNVVERSGRDRTGHVVHLIVSGLFLLLLAGRLVNAFAQPEHAVAAELELLVYSGTPSGVMAAVAAGRRGGRVVLIEPRTRIGGMISGGLVKTDIGSPDTIGGLARELFDRALAYYVETYGEDSRQVERAVGGRFDTGFFMEPKIGQMIMERMLEEAGVEVVTSRRIVGIDLSGTHIRGIAVEHPETGKRERYEADLFVDAGYEGDLMAMAHVPYRIGRESYEEYKEALAGINMGHPDSIGKGDHRIQAYNFRVTITNREDLAIPFPKPDNYRPGPHEHYIARVDREGLDEFADLFEIGKSMVAMHAGVNGKFDFNRNDMPGVNHTYPDGSYVERERIEAVVRDNFLGMLWMLQNDPRLPEAFREDAMGWGLPRDEHVDSGHFPDQIYLREGRRMLGRYVLTQHDIDYFRKKDDIVCQGSYNMDCHPVQKLGYAGRIKNEGHFNESTYDYSSRSARSGSRRAGARG